MYKLSNFIVIVLVIITGISYAEIINVPEDHETIQAGINVAEEGDTVLVQLGTYEENININDHSMTLASLTLITGDPAYIDSTIIDGGWQATVVNIGEIEGTVILRGFIIQNGNARNGGGGINVVNSDLLIEDMIIRNNTGQSGGGVYCNGESTIIIRRSVVENNRSDYAGGLYLGDLNATLENVIIRENFGGHVGVSKPFGSLNMRNVAFIDNEGRDCTSSESSGHFRPFAKV